MSDIVLDTNAFILYIVGRMNPEAIPFHKRTSLYAPEDFYHIQKIIAKYDRIITSPNVLTEVDNLLNNFTGENRYSYFKEFYDIVQDSMEVYVKSKAVCNDEKWIFEQVGLADYVVLKLAWNADYLISADSRLCDIAKSFEISHFDLKEFVNKRLLLN